MRRGLHTAGPAAARTTIVVLALLALVVGLALPAPAHARSRHAAARPGTGGAGRGTVLVDSGFRPALDGFSFANYGNAPGVPDLDPDTMRELFGNAVCAGFSGGTCVLSPTALAWMVQENDQMAGGHCVGLSVTALMFYAHLSSPVPYGAREVAQLRLKSNQLLAREIAYGYAFQSLDAVRRAEVSGSPRTLLAALIAGLKGSSELYTLGITQPDGSSGHAVTPYEIRQVGPNRYAVLVYDNNYPRVTRTVTIDTRSDTWTFEASPTPGPGESYVGNASTHSLLLLPMRPGLGVQPCPFCSATTDQPVATTARARRPARRYETVYLETSGSVGGHLLITDPRGRHTGFVHGRLVNQITGARVVRQFVSGPRTWLEHHDPEYELPTGHAYRIRLVAAGRAGRSRRTGRNRGSHASVVVLEPGFLAAVRSISTAPGQSDEIALSAAGQTIAFKPGRGARQAPELVLGTAQPGQKDHQWNITRVGAPSDQPIVASLDAARSRMSFAGTGTYDVSMDLLGNGVSVFAHNALTLGDGMATTLDYGQWTAGETMPATFTEDGTTGGQQELSDQPSPDTGSEFDPRESAPAPAQPQPDPVPARASTTSLTCSPGALAPGAATTCTAAVTALSSDASDTPGGLVRFASDGDGSFSASSCTLIDGTCEVTYTPASVGSGADDLTARYSGDGSFDPSDDTIAVDVAARSTATSLACSPAQLHVGDQTTCTATVTDTAEGAGATPTGEVKFSSDGPGSFSAGSCTLSGGSCHVTYTPDPAGSGTHIITATYDGDDVHGQSQDTTALDLTGGTGGTGGMATRTSIDCSPDPVSVDEPTTCTASVSGPDATSPPGGTVDFASGGDGAFSAGSCTLSGGSCQVQYTAASVGSGTQDLTATYQGDSTNASSVGSSSLQVSPRPTDTSFSCDPSSLNVGDQTTCTATVTDTGAATPSTPTGTVTFDDAAAGGTFAGNPCTLSGSGSTASCSVTYTAAQAGNVYVSASYSGDATHGSS